MTTLTSEAASDTGAMVALIQSVIGNEIAHLELARKQARRRLAVFEQRYAVTSAHFMQSMAAEDLAGGDDEYVQWAGEYTLMQRLEDKLRSLQEIEYRGASIAR